MSDITIRPATSCDDDWLYRLHVGETPTHHLLRHD